MNRRSRPGRESTPEPSSYRAAVVDLDGTVYRGGEPIPGAADGIRALREAGLDVRFVSNNPTRTPDSFARTLTSMGVSAEPEEVLTSGVVTVDYLRAVHPSATLFLVGEPGFRAQLREAGFEVHADPDRADVVVASYDRGFDYEKLVAAMGALADGDVRFVGTDPDRVIPAADGGLVPGSGAIVRAIAADREPDRVLGKPDPATADAVLERLGVDPGACLLVGDRLDTDVALGERVGMTTVLVLTGVSTRSDVRESGFEPDHVVESLAGIEAILEDRG